MEDRTSRFGTPFDFAQIGVEPLENGGMAWRARRGASRRGEHLLRIDSVHGSELGVRVNGETADAEHLLLEVWSTLGSLAGEEEVALESVGPAREHETLTVVEADRPYWEHLAPLGEAEAFVRSNLTEIVDESPRHPKIELPVRVRAGGLILNRKLGIETRYAAGGGRHSSIVSPLPSSEHRKLLERFFGEALVG